MLKQAKLNKISTALRHNKIAKGAAALAAVASLFGAPAYAEEAATTAESDVEVIEVKGIRGTVTRSINEKKNTASIVDAIAAADFGELPGLSISDIIENIPGASAIRLKGSQNEISIRGLGSNFGYATFNGRTITNGTGARSTNFKKFPSDLVDKVVVYKTQQADLVEGGTSGTIEIASLRAVDYGKNQTVVELQGIYNDQYSNVESPGVTPWGNKVVLSTIQSWETDSFGDFGFTLGYVESNDSNPEEFFNASSRSGVCALRAADGTALSDGGQNCSEAGRGSEQGISSGEVDRRTQISSREEIDAILANDPDADVSELSVLADFDPDSIFFVPETAAFRAVADVDTRQNTVVTFQWVPNDQWDINLDYEYSKLQTEEQRYEVGIDTRQSFLSNHVIADDRTLAYVEGRSRIDFQGEFRTQLDTYEGGGIEIAYAPNDALVLSADLSFSDSHRNRVRQRNNIRTADLYDYTFDARNSTVPEVRFLDDAGNDVNLTDLSQFVGNDTDTRIEFSRDNDRRDDDIWAVRFDADYALEHDIFSSVGVGVRYSREHLLDFQDNQVSLNLDGTQRTGSQQLNGSDVGTGGTAANQITEEALLQLGTDIANNCQVQYDNSELFQDGGGLGQTFAAIDSRCQIGEILDVLDTTARRELTGDVGDEGFFDIGERVNGQSGDDVDVREDILALYAIAHIDTELNDKPLSGNVGFRVVRTQVASQGIGDVLSVTSNPITDDDGNVLNTFTYSNSPGEAVNLRSDTSFFLPSFNLTYGVSDTFQVKAAASKSISRFRLDAFASGITIEECGDEGDTESCDPSTNTDLSEAIQSVDVDGNHLDPFVSNNFDLSFEWYPSADSAVTLGLYWKNFTGGSSLVTEQRDIEVFLDGTPTVFENVDVSVNQTDDNSSTIKGFEFVVNQNFSSLPAPFNGLGVNVAWNHAISDFVTPEVASPSIVDDANLFGFSEDVISSSLYWEGDKASVRLLYKYRSSFFQPNELPFPDRSARFTQATEYWDFSSKYKLTKNVSLSFKVLNLFDEPQVQTRSNGSTASDVSRSGRKFFLSAKVKF